MGVAAVAGAGGGETGLEEEGSAYGVVVCGAGGGEGGGEGELVVAEGA